MNRAVYRGAWRHFLISLALNCRSPQALVYGYLVPVFFLLAFGGIFRGSEPPLLSQMGQLITITVLGGACFGLPTQLVAERERGVWRRYRMLPVPLWTLLVSTLAARIVIVLSAVVLQVLLARGVFGTPLPEHPLATAGALLVVLISFLGLGLLVASLANDVPAVQALGQCLFLPMIILGGVGVPLETLPAWAQRASGFMPGRYAVELLQGTFRGAPAISEVRFDVIALAVIGLAAGLIGARLFRWQPGERFQRRSLPHVFVALLAWGVVGAIGTATGHVELVKKSLRLEDITDEHLAAITYVDLTGDNELVTRLAPPYTTIEDRFRVLALGEQIRNWPPGQVKDGAQRVRNLLSLAALADVNADVREADIGRLVYDHLRTTYSHAELRRILGWIILAPDAGTVVTAMPEFGFKKEVRAEVVRQRSVWYAKKYLGRLTGAIQEK
jgi:hypothetical protein